MQKYEKTEKQRESLKYNTTTILKYQKKTLFEVKTLEEKNAKNSWTKDQN